MDTHIEQTEYHLSDKDVFRIRWRDDFRCAHCGAAARDGATRMVVASGHLPSTRILRDGDWWTLCASCALGLPNLA